MLAHELFDARLNLVADAAECEQRVLLAAGDFAAGSCRCQDSSRRAAIAGRDRSTRRSHSVITVSMSPSGTCESGLGRWLEMSMPTSCITRTAYGCTPAAGCEPALQMRTPEGSSLRAQPSAIWLRAEFCVHRNSTPRGTRLTAAAPRPPEVADVLALDHEHDHLGQVRRVVGDALEVLRDRLHARRAVDVARVLHHVREELAEDLAVVGVDVRVALDDRLRALGVALRRRRRAPRAASPARPRPCSARSTYGLSGGSSLSSIDALADVHAEVADALEVGDDLERRS